jgi:pimeloyl-ACP methyl ester carboxylesterase
METSAAAVAEQPVEVDGLRTRCLNTGSGPPAVLLRATGESARVYAAELTVLRGAGPLARYTPEFFERYVVALLDRLGSSVLCWSATRLGSLATLRLALSSPERVWPWCWW